jgi:hypothetical protein
MRRFLVSAACGLAGVLIGCLILQQVVNRWKSFDIYLLLLHALLALYGIRTGRHLCSDSREGEGMPIRNRYEVMSYSILGAAISSLSTFLAFVITSRTWFADRIDPTFSSLWYQLLHPWILPPFYATDWHGNPNEVTWWFMSAVGFGVGLFSSWNALTQPLISRQPDRTEFADASKPGHLPQRLGWSILGGSLILMLGLLVFVAMCS